MKEKFIEIIDDYVEDAKLLGKSLKEKFKNDINDPKERKKYGIVASVLLVITILLANLFTSSAYYYDETDGFTIINAVVGNMYIDDYDYTLLVFTETNPKSGIYVLAADIPSTGYTYNGYTCLNNSNLVYESSSMMASTTISTKDVCTVYFNR